MKVKYGKTTRAQRRRKLETIGVIGVCNTCNEHADSLGFKCVCKWVECVACWFQRTKGHKNRNAPFWQCKECGMVSIYDRDMNFIKRWSSDQWKQWNKIGRGLEQSKGKKDGYEIAEGTI